MELDPDWDKARERIIKAAGAGNHAAMQAFAIMSLADAVMALAPPTLSFDPERAEQLRPIIDSVFGKRGDAPPAGDGK